MDLTKICKYLNNNYMNEYEYIEYGNLWDVKVSVAFLDNFKIEGDTLVAPVQITVEDDDGKSIDEVEYYKTDFIFYIENNVIKLKLNQYPREVSEYYNLDFDLKDLQRNYKFTSKASGSVPQALYVFFESNNFEDAIRKAISMGGDCDTIACIVGSLAEACYGIPDDIKNSVKLYLKDYMYDLLEDIYFSNDRVKCRRSDNNDQKY